MASRTTDDYQQLSLSGCVAVTEPAFWAGYAAVRGRLRGLLQTLTDFEPKRAAKYGVQHYTWMSLNPKEAEDES